MSKYQVEFVAFGDVMKNRFFHAEHELNQVLAASRGEAGCLQEERGRGKTER